MSSDQLTARRQMLDIIHTKRSNSCHGYFLRLMIDREEIINPVLLYILVRYYKLKTIEKQGKVVVSNESVLKIDE